MVYELPPAVSSDGVKDLQSIEDGDVVILPAFGASLEEMQILDAKNVQVVDTTCPWVSKVWNTVDKHTKVGEVFNHGVLTHQSCLRRRKDLPQKKKWKNMMVESVFCFVFVFVGGALVYTSLRWGVYISYAGHIVLFV